MAIPELQLETWSHQGAVTTASNTADSIKSALERYVQWPDDMNYEVYLQGSYKNTTNIRGDSDVDVVAQLNTTFSSNLTEEQKRELNLETANYHWRNFREDVLTALILVYGAETVLESNKSLKVVGGSGRLPADVVPCTLYRNYYQVERYSYAEGMCFWTRSDGRMIINYPKLHYDNGVTKMANTNNNYKKTVRIFKNIRTHLAVNNIITNSLAPSYFVECLLYNVPNNHFIQNTLQNIFISVVNWLNSESSWANFRCQNEQQDLFGSSSEQWSLGNARTFLSRVIYLWNEWR